MKATWRTWLIAALAVFSPVLVQAQRFDTRSVEVEVINDRGQAFAQYPLRGEGRSRDYKAYLQARRDSNYALRIRNLTNERIGVVVAVDGRNIISGERSDLRPDERMYVLGPREQGTYEGWRTGRDQVNRFYFTDAGDSYASAWGDRSAMGVIAVAAFREVAPYMPPPEPRGDRRYQSTPEAAGAPPAPGAAPRLKSEPGTGYGEREWSPSRRVDFEAERRPFARYFLKYAWRDTLCRQGVIEDCGRRGQGNRFWDEPNGGYAPPPPRHGHSGDNYDNYQDNRH